MTPLEPDPLDSMPEPSSEERTEPTGQNRSKSILPPRREKMVPDEDQAGDDSGGKEAGSSKPDRSKARMIPSKEAVLGESVNPFVSIEEKDWSETTAFKKSWMVGIALLVLALIVGSLLMLQQSGQGSGAEKKDQEQKRKALAKARDAEIKDLVQRANQARNMFGDFATSQVVDEILPMIRNSAELEETIRRVGHKRMVEGKWKPSDKSRWGLNLFAGKPYMRLTGEYPDLNEFSAYFVVEDDKLLLDWKATTAYGTASFEALAQGEGDGSEIRGKLRAADFYAKGFNELEYQSYQLESPRGRNMIWCYVKRGSDEAEQLGRLFGRGEVIEGEDREIPMTIQLKHLPELGLPNQWLIEALHHEEWIKM